MHPFARVLLIDDDLLWLETLAEFLRRKGFVVFEAADAGRALEIVANDDITLVISDYKLPGMDGWELTRRLKTNFVTRSIPVVALSPYAMRGDEARARAVRCDGYIAKPITTEELPAIVSRHLSRGR